MRWLAFVALISVYSSIGLSSDTCRLAGSPTALQQEVLGIKYIFECDHQPKDFGIISLDSPVESITVRVKNGGKYVDVILPHPPGNLGQYVARANVDSWVRQQLDSKGIPSTDVFLGQFSIGSQVKFTGVDDAFWKKMCDTGRFGPATCRSHEIEKLSTDEIIKLPGTKRVEFPDPDPTDDDFNSPPPAKAKAKPQGRN